MPKKIKKINLSTVYKNLLMFSGSITIVVGMINQLVKVFTDYTAKAVKVGETVRSAMTPISDSTAVHVMSAIRQINPIKHFFSDNWQLILIGLGIVIVVFVIIFVKEEIKEHKK
jgi:hypothetical protein